MSKRSKFVMCTWVGPNVSVMKKAKMSTDKALMKDIIQVGDIMQNGITFLILLHIIYYLLFYYILFIKQNLSVELQCENANELTMDHFKAEVDKAGGARYKIIIL